MPKGVYDRTGSTVDVVEAPQNRKDVQVPIDGKIDGLVQEVEVYGDVKTLSDKAAELAFMEEPVRIYLHESTNPNDEQFVFLSVNGDSAQPGNPYLRRGGEYTVKRKFVGVLAQARAINYSQPFQGSGDMQRENVLRPHVAMKYPFSVMEDRNPRGASWLKSVMSR